MYFSGLQVNFDLLIAEVWSRSWPFVLSSAISKWHDFLSPALALDASTHCDD